MEQTRQLINELSPRWAGFNLLAPTYEISARIAAGLDPSISVMVGGHQAKAMPTETLTDPRFARCEALVLGEGETRVVELLKDLRYRTELPGVMWLDPILKTPVTGGSMGAGHHLAPDVDALPFVDRAFLADDPYRAGDGRLEANMVGARGCPYDCSFCGAAVSANPDTTLSHSASLNPGCPTITQPPPQPWRVTARPGLCGTPRGRASRWRWSCTPIWWPRSPSSRTRPSSS